jgi:hypothetical protein
MIMTGLIFNVKGAFLLHFTRQDRSLTSLKSSTSNYYENIVVSLIEE